MYCLLLAHSQYVMSDFLHVWIPYTAGFAKISFRLLVSFGGCPNSDI